MGDLLHQAVDKWAAETPDRSAFRLGDEDLTYAALRRRANKLAGVLRSEGLERGERVAIYMPKCLELPVAIYGILKAGGVYVPVDPLLPPERIRTILNDCGVRMLATAGGPARRVPGLVAGTGLACIIGTTAPPEGGSAARHWSWHEVDEAEAFGPGTEGKEEDLAYIMYTSGSTGLPKGLMHTHRSGMAYVRWSARTYGVTGADRLGNHAPLHFDISTFDYLTGPFCGATTVLVPEEVMMMPAGLAELVEKESLTIWYSVPLALVQLLQHGGLAGRNLDALRWVIFGGEPFPPKFLWELMRLMPKARFSNSYGPAEVNQCTYYHVPRERMGSEDALPLGQVWDGAEGVVADEAGREVESGEPGELLICSDTMMNGYWNRPDLNERAFFDLAIPEGGTQRFFRTGDLVQELNGELHFLGRKDRQVKVRGYRVELDEVEHVLNKTEGVHEAAVVALKDPEGDAAIVAGIVADGAGEIDEAALRKAATERLPPYALPRRYEILTAFPRTTSGKIDRRKLAGQFQEKSAN